MLAGLGTSGLVGPVSPRCVVPTLQPSLHSQLSIGTFPNRTTGWSSAYKVNIIAGVNSGNNLNLVGSNGTANIRFTSTSGGAASLTFSASDSSLTVGLFKLTSGGGGISFLNAGTTQAARILSPADNNLQFVDAAGTGFSGRLMFGGTTSSFPALGRSTTFLTVLLADGTAGGGLQLSEGASIDLGTMTGSKIGNTVSQKLGFWNATPIIQPAGATQVAPAAYVTGAFGLDSNANMQALYDLVVAMRTALVNSGLMKGAA